MTGDRMVIKSPQGKKKAIVGEDNVVRDPKPCLHFKDYKGARKPKCNCQPCWDKWIHSQQAANPKEQ
jgi:hypothetical protein